MKSSEFLQSFVIHCLSKLRQIQLVPRKQEKPQHTSCFIAVFEFSKSTLSILKPCKCYAVDGNLTEFD